MEKHVALAALVFALWLAPAWTGYARGQAGLPAHADWEYRVDPVPGVERSLRMANEFDTEVTERNRARHEKLLNQRAAEGCELTAVAGSYHCFRRPR